MTSFCDETQNMNMDEDSNEVMNIQESIGSSEVNTICIILSCLQTVKIYLFYL